MYFTGSDHFNRSMRFYAKKKKWTLSDHGLAPAVRVRGSKVWSGKSVYCRTEEDIFTALGIQTTLSTIIIAIIICDIACID
jgi:DNA polymerase lambda